MLTLRPRYALTALLLAGGGVRAAALFGFGQGSIPEACAAKTTMVQLSDPMTSRPPNDPDPLPVDDLKSQSRNAVRILGSGARASADGQTLTWRHPSASAKSCQAKLTELARRFPNRVRFSPAEDRIDVARTRVAAVLPSQLPKSLRADPSKSGAFFDHSAARASEELMFDRASGAPVPAWVYPALSRPQNAPLKPAFRARAAAHAPRTASVEPPAPPKPRPAPRPFGEFGRKVKRDVDVAVRQIRTNVDTSLRATGDALRGTQQFITQGVRQVSNRLFKGIEMVAGYGYTLVRADQRQSNFGTNRLVVGVQRVAAYLRSSGIVSTELVIGDMSRWDGAKLGRHLSHRSGRDMDIGYYMVDRRGSPIQGADLIPLDRNLKGVQNGGYVYLDSARSWQLLRAFLASPDFKVQLIFVAPQIKTALLKEAARVNDPLRAQAASILNTNWPGHNSHLHLRVQ